jgi:hypothetical protein
LQILRIAGPQAHSPQFRLDRQQRRTELGRPQIGTAITLAMLRGSILKSGGQVVNGLHSSKKQIFKKLFS